jgi:hypothetical protein
MDRPRLALRTLEPSPTGRRGSALVPRPKATSCTGWCRTSMWRLLLLLAAECGESLRTRRLFAYAGEGETSRPARRGLGL